MAPDPIQPGRAQRGILGIALTYKLATIALLFAGEAFSVYAEMLAAQGHASNPESFLRVFLKAFLQITVAGALLVAGYMFGYRAFRNIWVISAMSITSILIMEPLIGYLVFRQLPTHGALLGLVFGAAGFIVTFVF